MEATGESSWVCGMSFEARLERHLVLEKPAV
jgi:hypothetical protein